ncbi:unnamed protein product, partial [Ixodes hexagonus]
TKSLFLTPYIERGDIEEARKLSHVTLFSEAAGAAAHSGYITVNKKFSSNLFFLFMRAKESATTAPLLLWLQGGPGLSSLFGQFLEIGPVGIDAHGRTFSRELTIQRRMNIIFLDEPVGAGFSYTTAIKGLAYSLDEVSDDMLEFLEQFMVMFPEFKNRDFYVAGESYGARYTVGISHLLHKKKDAVPLNLRGLICGVGFLGPILKVADSADFLYQNSMLTKSGRKKFASRFSKIRTTAKFSETMALVLLMRTIFTSDLKPTLFQELTGYQNHASTLYSREPPHMTAYENYVQTSEFKRAVHVGSAVKFEKNMTKLMLGLKEDYLTDITQRIIALLDNYKVLFYTGQMDALFPSVNQQTFFRSLKWKGANDFRKCERQEWVAGNGSKNLAGYKTQVRNFTEMVLIKAGHYAAVDVPEVTYHMMAEFFEFPDAIKTT